MPSSRAAEWLTDERLTWLQPFFPESHGTPQGDDGRVSSGIVFVDRNGLRWCDEPTDYDPHKPVSSGGERTLCARWKRWEEKGAFRRTIEGSAAASADPKTVMIDATDLKGASHGIAPAG